MIDELKKIASEYEKSEWGVSFSIRKISRSKSVFLNGKKEEDQAEKDLGVMIELSKGGKVVRYGSPSTSAEHVKRILEMLKQKHSCFSAHFIDSSSYGLESGEIVDLSSPVEMNAQKYEQDLVALSKLDRNWMDNTRASLSLLEEERIILNSNRGYFHDRKYYTDFYLNLIGSRNGVVQNRTNGGVIFQGGVTSNFLESALKSKEDFSNELDQLLEAPVCPKFTGSLILPSDQMYIQIHESIGHPLELDRILGDERNYAGGSFVKKEDFGRLRYGPKSMNVFFGPDVLSQPVTQQFDDTGAKAKRVTLIEQGVLKAGIGGRESQKRLGVPGTSSTRNCNWNRPPIDRMGNINLEFGTSSLEDMVSKVENGILMKTNKSWSIDDQRDKFQFGCEVGYLIKDGSIKNIVRAPNYEGRTIPFWNSLEMVGNQHTLGDFGTPTCGKGEPNQAVRVGHQSPTCLFNNISIFPGE